jgi:hypothetical protein
MRGSKMIQPGQSIMGVPATTKAIFANERYKELLAGMFLNSNENVKIFGNGRRNLHSPFGGIIGFPTFHQIFAIIILRIYYNKFTVN